MHHAHITETKIITTRHDDDSITLALTENSYRTQNRQRSYVRPVNSHFKPPPPKSSLPGKLVHKRLTNPEDDSSTLFSSRLDPTDEDHSSLEKAYNHGGTQVNNRIKLMTAEGALVIPSTPRGFFEKPVDTEFLVRGVDPVYVLSDPANETQEFLGHVQPHKVPGWVLTIQNGKLRRDYPAFKKFETVADQSNLLVAAEWLLSKVELWMVEYDVTCADLDCYRLLAYCTKPTIYPFKRDEAIDLFHDRESIETILKKPRQQSDDSMVTIRLANVIKLFKNRVLHKRVQAMIKATRVIQRAWRRRLCQIKLRKSMAKRHQDSVTLFTRLRLKMKREQLTIFNYSRTIVYVCNRVSSTKMPLQLSKLIHLQDFSVTLVLVVPCMPKGFEDLAKYLGQNSFLKKELIVSKRLQVICPSSFSYLPSSCTVAKALLYDTQAFKKVRRLCEGVGILFVDDLSADAIQLSSRLHIPCYGPSIEAYETYLASPEKTQILLRDASIHRLHQVHLPSDKKTTAQGIKSTHTAIFRIKARFPNVKSWNIYFEHSQGSSKSASIQTPNAILDADKLSNVEPLMVSTLPNLLHRRRFSVVVPNFQHQPLLDVHEVHNVKQGPSSLLSPAIHSQLNQRRGSVVSRCPSPSFADKDPLELEEEIISAISTTNSMETLNPLTSKDVLRYVELHGAHLEENPLVEENSCRIIEVCIDIEMSRQLKTICTTETVLVHGESVCIYVPQQTIDDDAIHKAIEDLAHTCIAKDIFGLLTITFISWKDAHAPSHPWRFLARGLQMGMTERISRGICNILASQNGVFISPNRQLQVKLVDPNRMSHFHKASYVNQEQVNKRFEALVPLCPERTMVILDNLEHSLIEIVRPKIILNRLSKIIPTVFDPWTCQGIFISECDPRKPSNLPVIAIHFNRTEALHLVLESLLRIHYCLEAKTTPHSTNFVEKAKFLIEEYNLSMAKETISEELLARDGSVTINTLTPLPPISIESSHQRREEDINIDKVESMLIQFIQKRTSDMTTRRSTTPLPYNENNSNAPTKKLVSSEVFFLLQEMIPSEFAAQHDPTFHKPNITPPQQRRRGRKRAHTTLNAAASLIVEQEKRAAALVERLEILEGDIQSGPVEDSKLQDALALLRKTPWHKLVRNPAHEILTAFEVVKTLKQSEKAEEDTTRVNATSPSESALHQKHSTTSRPKSVPGENF